MRDLRREFPGVSGASIHQSLRQLLELRLLSEHGGLYQVDVEQVGNIDFALRFTCFPSGMGRAPEPADPWLTWELAILRRQKYRLLIGALRRGERNRQALMEASRLQSGELSAATAALIQAGIVLPYSLEQVSEPTPHTGALLHELRRSP